MTTNSAKKKCRPTFILRFNAVLKCYAHRSFILVTHLRHGNHGLGGAVVAIRKGQCCSYQMETPVLLNARNVSASLHFDLNDDVLLWLSG
jgi:hypothetical protein